MVFIMQLRKIFTVILSASIAIPHLVFDEVRQLLFSRFSFLILKLKPANAIPYN